MYLQHATFVPCKVLASKHGQWKAHSGFEITCSEDLISHGFQISKPPKHQDLLSAYSQDIELSQASFSAESASFSATFAPLELCRGPPHSHLEHWKHVRIAMMGSRKLQLGIPERCRCCAVAGNNAESSSGHPVQVQPGTYTTTSDHMRWILLSFSDTTTLKAVDALLQTAKQKALEQITASASAATISAREFSEEPRASTSWQAVEQRRSQPETRDLDAHDHGAPWLKLGAQLQSTMSADAHGHVYAPTTEYENGKPLATLVAGHAASAAAHTGLGMQNVNTSLGNRSRSRPTARSALSQRQQAVAKVSPGKSCNRGCSPRRPWLQPGTSEQGTQTDQQQAQLTPDSTAGSASAAVVQNPLTIHSQQDINAILQHPQFPELLQSVCASLLASPWPDAAK